jgi:coenzyme F420-dependent glucose-6-phosphate dehydrogenase
MFPAMERGAKSVGRDPDAVLKILEIWVAYDEDYEKALKAARFWAASPLPFVYKYAISDPREIEQYGSLVGDEQFSRYFLIGTRPEDHIKHLERFIKIGFGVIHVLSSSPDEIKTIRMYAKHVLPYIKSTYGT